MKRIGLIVLVLLGVLDLVWPVTVVPLDTPVAVGVLGAVFGLTTLAVARPAWRGSRPAVVGLYAARILSALVLGLPAFFVPDAPGWAQILVALSMLLTIAGGWMFAAGTESRVRPAVAGR